MSHFKNIQQFSSHQLKSDGDAPESPRYFHNIYRAVLNDQPVIMNETRSNIFNKIVLLETKSFYVQPRLGAVNDQR